jgi:hypothetical protein
MFELLHSSNTGRFLTAPHVSLLFHPGPKLNVSCRQAYTAGLRNAASLKVIWDELTLPFTLKFS